MRAQVGLIVLVVAVSAVAWAEGKKKPLKSNEGGAEKYWMCRQLTDAACDLAKRCDDPAKSLRHCKRARARCDFGTEGTSEAATQDDVQVCGQAISDLACGDVTFDNEMGITFDMKRITACSSSRNDWAAWALLAAAKLPKSGFGEEKTEGKEHENTGEIVGGGGEGESSPGLHDFEAASTRSDLWLARPWKRVRWSRCPRPVTPLWSATLVTLAVACGPAPKQTSGSTAATVGSRSASSAAGLAGGFTNGLGPTAGVASSTGTSTGGTPGSGTGGLSSTAASSMGGTTGAPGADGSPCSRNSNCSSSICQAVDPGLTQGICVSACQQESDCAADPGFFCEAQRPGSANGFCVPPSSSDCLACTQDKDCGWLSERCIQLPGDDAPACHVDCSLGGADACPDDYSCDSESLDGGSAQLCVPMSGSCSSAQGGDCTRSSAPQSCSIPTTPGPARANAPATSMPAAIPPAMPRRPPA